MAGFFPGSNDVDAREKALQGMMAVRTDGPFIGTPKLQVMRGRMGELEKQIRRAHTDPKRPDKRYKDKSQPSDLIEDLEYAAAFDPRYYEPEKAVQVKEINAYDLWKADVAQQRKIARKRFRQDVPT
jgi:hypothetical protein